MPYPTKLEWNKLDQDIGVALDICIKLPPSKERALIGTYTTQREAHRVRQRLYGLLKLLYNETGHVKLSITQSGELWGRKRGTPNEQDDRV